MKKKGTSVVKEEVLVFSVGSVRLWLTWVNFQVGRDVQLLIIKKKNP